MARVKRVFNFTTPRVHTTSIMNLSQTVQLTRLGKIRLGIRTPITKEGKNEKCRKANHPNDELCMYCSYPVQTDHFVFDGPEDYPPGIYEALIKEYGEKGKSLQFYFPTENRALVFPQALKFYKGSRLFCRGDGQTATRIDEQNGGMFSLKCPCEFLGNGCAPRASLMIALYKIKVQGCFQIDTGSIHNIIRTNSFMNEISGDPAFPETREQSLLRRISYVPLRLSLVPQQINTPEGKPVTKPLWTFTFDGDGRMAAQLRQRDAISALLPGQPELPSLPPAPDDRHDDVRDQEGPTINGKPLTPPDQAASVPEVVGATEGPQDEPEREPGADEGELTTEQKGGKTPDPESGKPPFPAEEKKPINGEKALSPNAQSAAFLLRGTQAPLELELAWREQVIKNKKLSGEDKLALQKVKDEKMKALQG
jgi:hypothetical protein